MHVRCWAMWDTISSQCTRPRAGVWKATVVKDYGKGKPAWSVSWSTAGAVLAACAAGDDDADVSTELFKEAADGAWEVVAAPAAEQAPEQ
jgi:hypothetical protein